MLDQRIASSIGVSVLGFPVLGLASMIRKVAASQRAIFLQRRRDAGAIKAQLAAFPETCPWTVDQLLDDTFWPETTGEAP